MPKRNLPVLIALLFSCAHQSILNPADQFMKNSAGKLLHISPAYMPLQCIGHPSVTFEDYQLYRKAARELNGAAGVELLGEFCISWLLDAPFPTRPIPGIVLVHIGIPSQHEVIAKTKDSVVQRRQEGELRTIGLTVPYTSTRNPDEIFEIMLYIHPDRRYDVNVWRHELGHIVGLDHDECCKDSIMYPIIFDDIHQSFLPEDIDALRAVYGPFSY